MTNDEPRRDLPVLEDVEEFEYVAPPYTCKTCGTTACGGAWYVGEPCVWRCGLLQ